MNLLRKVREYGMSFVYRKEDEVEEITGKLIRRALYFEKTNRGGFSVIEYNRWCSQFPADAAILWDEGLTMEGLGRFVSERVERYSSLRYLVHVQNPLNSEWLNAIKDAISASESFANEAPNNNEPETIEPVDPAADLNNNPATGVIANTPTTTEEASRIPDVSRIDAEVGHTNPEHPSILTFDTPQHEVS